MSQPLLRPSFTADIAGLDRRVGNLERRTTPKVATTRTATAATSYVGTYVWMQRFVTVPSNSIGIVDTTIAWLPEEVLSSWGEPAPFWDVSDGMVNLGPGVYDVTLGLSLQEVPFGTGGKIISGDGGVWLQYFEIVPDVVGTYGGNMLTSTFNWRHVVLPPGSGGLLGSTLLYPYESTRIGHNLGSDIDMFVNLIIIKIGQVDG